MRNGSYARRRIEKLKKNIADLRAEKSAIEEEASALAKENERLVKALDDAIAKVDRVTALFQTATADYNDGLLKADDARKTYKRAILKQKLASREYDEQMQSLLSSMRAQTKDKRAVTDAFN